MKRFLFVAVLLFTAKAFGQTIPEPGFETWVASGPFTAPNGWSVTPGVVKSPDAHSGSWALQCKVDTFTNPMTSTLDTVPAMAYTGAAIMGPPTPGASFGGYAYSGWMADSMIGYFKFQGAPGDSMVVLGYFSYWDTVTHSRQIIKQGIFSTDQQTTIYQRFAVPVTLLGSFHNCDTAFVQVMSVNPQHPYHMGTTVLVDDISFFTFPDAVNSVQAAAFGVYPNPVSDRIYIKGENVKKATLLNMAGQVLAESTSAYIDVANVPTGMYLARIEAKDGSVTVKQLIKQ
jgi:hypothetical protein